MNRGPDANHTARAEEMVGARNRGRGFAARAPGAHHHGSNGGDGEHRGEEYVRGNSVGNVGSGVRGVTLSGRPRQPGSRTRRESALEKPSGCFLVTCTPLKHRLLGGAQSVSLKWKFEERGDGQATTLDFSQNFEATSLFAGTTAHRGARGWSGTNDEYKAMPAREKERPVRGVQPLPARQGEVQLRAVQPLSAREGEKQLRAVQPLPSRQAEKELRRVQPLSAREADKGVRGMQPLTPQQAEKQLRGVQPVPSREGETRLREVQPLPPRQAEKQLRKVQTLPPRQAETQLPGVHLMPPRQAEIHVRGLQPVSSRQV